MFQNVHCNNQIVQYKVTSSLKTTNIATGILTVTYYKDKLRPFYVL